MIFDCDGTLVDSEPLARRAWARALEPYGYEVTDEDLAACLGRPYPHTHAHFAARVELPSAGAFWPPFSRRLFALLEQELTPFADAVAAARELRRRGISVAVASSSARERLDLTLRHAGLARDFAVSVAGDEVAAGKPAPDMFLAAARRLGVAPESCVAVEDSPAGVEAALRAGMVAVAVARTAQDEPALSGAHAILRELDADALLAARAPDPGEGLGG